MIAADAIVKCLEAEGVEYVFGYPGVAICPFYDSILNTNIKTILVRQEQNAAHEASGYARISGKVGVAVVTSGPGATNLITGIATAFADSIPLVCITGQVDSGLMGSDVFQEVDVSGACESFVKFSYIVRKASDIPRIMKEAFHIASTGRKGPVLIDIPIDVQKAEIRKFAYPESVSIRTYKPTVVGHAVQIKKVIKELQKAKRPIICVGGGVHLSSGAKEEVRRFVEEKDIPVVCTMMGLGVLPTNHFLFYGMVGNNGQAYGNRAMNDADMIIMVGARVADRSFSQPDLITENKVLVHIDVDPAEIGKNAGPTIPLVGDIKHVFEEFNKAQITADYSLWIDKLDGYKDDTQNASRSQSGDLYKAPVQSNEGRHGLCGGRRTEPALVLCELRHQGKRPLPDKRRYGDHGILCSRGAGRQTRGAGTAGRGGVRRRRFPDDDDGTCYYEAVQGACQDRCSQKQCPWPGAPVSALYLSGPLLGHRPGRLHYNVDAIG